MKSLVQISVLLFALVVVWPSATAAATSVLDVSLALRSAFIGFVGGLVFSLIVAYAWIHNALVEADRRRDLDKINDTHDKRRI